jgi:hypothetical protein
MQTTGKFKIGILGIGGVGGYFGGKLAGYYEQSDDVQSFSLPGVKTKRRFSSRAFKSFLPTGVRRFIQRWLQTTRMKSVRSSAHLLH